MRVSSLEDTPPLPNALGPGLSPGPFFLGFSTLPLAVAAPAAPRRVESASGAAKGMKVDRQDHDAERQHPESENRQEPEHPAKHQGASQQNPLQLRARQPNRVAAESKVMARRRRVGHLENPVHASKLI